MYSLPLAFVTRIIKVCFRGQLQWRPQHLRYVVCHKHESNVREPWLGTVVMHSSQSSILSFTKSIFLYYWDLLVALLSNRFLRATNFNQNLPWNTSGVLGMESMFYFALNFNSASVGSWDVSKVQSFKAMFAGACVRVVSLSLYPDKYNTVAIRLMCAFLLRFFRPSLL